MVAQTCNVSSQEAETSALWVANQLSFIARTYQKSKEKFKANTQNDLNEKTLKTRKFR